jgi:hypothetical protein
MGVTVKSAVPSVEKQIDCPTAEEIAAASEGWEEYPICEMQSYCFLNYV